MDRSEAVAENKRRSLADAHLYTGDEVAALIGIAAGTLSNWRVRGFGPRYIRVGRLIRYRPADVRRWLAQRECASTDESEAAAS